MLNSLLRVKELYFISTVLLVFCVLFSSEVEAKNNWQLSKQSEGIQVYGSHNPNSPLKVFKGVVTVSENLTTLMAVLDDTKALPKLLHDCKKANLVSKAGDNSSTVHVVTKMPWPVKNRDTVVNSVVTQDKLTKRVLVKMKSKPNDVPLTSGMVRVQTMSGYWEFLPIIKDGKDTGEVKITYELSLDPGGNLPKWLVNTLAVDFPFYTLKNLRKLAKNPVYRTARHPFINN